MSSPSNNLEEWEKALNTLPVPGPTSEGDEQVAPTRAPTAPAEKKSVIDARKRLADAKAVMDAAQKKATDFKAKAEEAEARATEAEARAVAGAKEKAAEALKKGAQAKRKLAEQEKAAAGKADKLLAEAQIIFTAAETALAEVEARAAAEAKAKAEEEAAEAERKAAAKAAAEAAAAALPKLTAEEEAELEGKYLKGRKAVVEEEETGRAPSPPAEPQPQMPDVIISTVYSQVYDSEPSSIQGLDPSDRRYKQRVVSFVDIPAGTVLFRGERLPDPEEGEDLRNFYRDFLGSIGADGRFCMPPTYNVFFYPFPYVAFGAEDYGERFNALQMYVTRKKITLACMIGPSDKVRGSPKGYDAFMPIMRCNKVYETDPKEFEPILCGATGEKKDRKLDAMSYDNCLNPYYMDALRNRGSREIPLHGWIAIAEKDSFDIFEGQGKNKRVTRKGKNTPMGTYLKQLEGRFPGKVSEVLSWMYTDQAGHRGFPEISLYPMTPHPGVETRYIDAPTMDSALDFISENSDKFIYLPLACFTATQTLDGLETDYAVTNIPKENRKRFPREAERAADAATLRGTVRQGIERQVDAYMTRFMTEGIEIPGVGLSKIVFDPRTGFYVVDSFIRKKNPIIQDITKIYEGGMNPYFPYLSILMPLETPEDRKLAMDYCIIYNRFNPQKLFNPELLYQEGPVVYRSFIFTRPSNYQALFTNMDSKFPLNLKLATNRATFKFKRNIINRGETLEKGFTTKELGKAPGTKRRFQKGGRHMRTRKQQRSMLEAIAGENLGVMKDTLLLATQ